MKKIIAVVFLFVCFVSSYSIWADESWTDEGFFNDIGDDPGTDNQRQVPEMLVLEPAVQPNQVSQAAYMQCDVDQPGKAPLKMAFNVLSAVPNIPARYSLMPKAFTMLGDQAELVSDVGSEPITFRVFDQHRLEHLKVMDCYAISVSEI